MMARKVAIVAANRIPFARQGTAYADLPNLVMLTDTLKGLVARSRQTGTGEDEMGELKRGPELKRALEAARRVLSAQREALIEERDQGRLDDEVMRELLEDIDLEEAVVASRRARIPG